jgi:hypothetical protein
MRRHLLVDLGMAGVLAIVACAGDSHAQTGPATAPAPAPASATAPAVAPTPIARDQTQPVAGQIARRASDGDILTSVVDRLVTQRVPIDGLEVNVENGVVELRGEMPTDLEGRAIAGAATTPGVTKVISYVERPMGASERRRP